MERHDDPVPGIPVSTYRLQFSHLFRFADAAAIVAYLHDLGISDIYASPLCRAAGKSLHGYDVVDPTVLNPELGTEKAFDEFAGELKRKGMGLFLDIVPNHMAWNSDNRWWMDLLENGPGSPYADFFAVDWHSATPSLSVKLLLPFLGEPYGRALENRELTLIFHEGAFFIRYHDWRLPLLPESYRLILEHRGALRRRLLPDGHPDLEELLSIVSALRHLPSVTVNREEAGAERQREKEIVKRRLAALFWKSAEVRSFLEENVRLYNGSKGDPGSFDLLDRLLGAQLWRLAHWSVATEEINYRRFFDINHLAALRMENPAVFEKTHALVLRLIGEGKVTGLRIDHPDGLCDPQRYLERLQAACLARLAAGASREDLEPPGNDGKARQCHPALPAVEPRGKPFYLLGEKILTEDETLPEEWPVFGTTGYDHLNWVNGLFVDGGKAQKFADLYGNFTGIRADFSAIRHEKKRLVMETTMSGEIDNLGKSLAGIAGKHRHGRDFTLRGLTRALAEVIAFFPVYRSYIRSPVLHERDRAYVAAAVDEAKKNNPPGKAPIFDFLRDILLLRFPADFGEEERREGLDFVMRFQQTTAPVMAKGVEDTAFYVYNCLLSLNEVGGNPGRFGVTVQEFHDRNGERLRNWPHALNATSTHDTKRSEDVRARINVLSEIPERWERRLYAWSRFNTPKKTFREGRPVPDRNEEYLLYQTLIGAWPPGRFPGDGFGEFRKRIGNFMVKALREAKVHSSWITPDRGYESSVASFVEAILAVGPDNEFLQDFEPFRKTISFFGMVNSLSQTLLKIASPGVPDFFQGTELWDFSLVDPDNRRPVDFAGRQARLASLRKEMARSGSDFTPFLKRLMADWEEGTLKLYVTRQALYCRQANQALFTGGAYVPLYGEGEMAEHLCAFARRGEAGAVLTVVPRLLAGILPFDPALPSGRKIWEKTALALPEAIRENRFRNVLTGEIVEATRSGEKRLLPMAALFPVFPAAMLETAGGLKGERK